MCLTTPCPLTQGHEMTSIGLLLGVSAAKLGTMDMAITRLLSIHVPALLPPTSTELDVPHNVQVAAVVGIGLVYQGTAHRHTAEVLLAEIGGCQHWQNRMRAGIVAVCTRELGVVTLAPSHHNIIFPFFQNLMVRPGSLCSIKRKVTGFRKRNVAASLLFLLLPPGNLVS